MDPVTSAIGTGIGKAIGGIAGGGGPTMSSGAAYGSTNNINVSPPNREEWRKWAIAAGAAMLVYIVWKKQR